MSRTYKDRVDTPEIDAAVQAASQSSPRQALYMSTVGARHKKRWFLGKFGKWVKNRGHARRFNPEEARRFLSKTGRPVTWTVD